MCRIGKRRGKRKNRNEDKKNTRALTRIHSRVYVYVEKKSDGSTRGGLCEREAGGNGRGGFSLIVSYWRFSIYPSTSSFSAYPLRVDGGSVARFSTYVCMYVRARETRDKLVVVRGTRIWYTYARSCFRAPRRNISLAVGPLEGMQGEGEAQHFDESPSSPIPQIDRYDGGHCRCTDFRWQATRKKEVDWPTGAPCAASRTGWPCHREPFAHLSAGVRKGHSMANLTKRLSRSIIPPPIPSHCRW